MVGQGPVLSRLDTASAALGRVWPRLFAFNFLIVAQKDEELADIYERTAASSIAAATDAEPHP
jgi:hypothetical protein